MFFRYHSASRSWSLLQERDSVDNLFGRITLDAPAVARKDGLFELTEDVDIIRDGYHVSISRKTPVPGVVKHEEMREWCVALTDHGERWLVFRQDTQGVVVTTDNLVLDCHAITTADGTLHCNAEMLATGTTNRLNSIKAAKRVRLRTLSLYDQIVNIPVAGTTRTVARA